MVKRFIRLLCMLCLLSGCAYSVYSNAYPHLKKIRVESFENLSTDFEIASKLLDRLTIEFRNDGRLRPVTVGPDCVLEGTVNSYEEKIYSYDSANQVQDYQLVLSMSITFTDLINNQIIYENRSFTASELYAVGTESSARYKDKTEAEEELLKSVFRTLVQNTLEAW